MRVAASICFVSMMGVAVACEAIDNPDAPDFVAEFNARAKKYENDIRRNAAATEDVRQAYAAYEQFLEAELAKAYPALLAKLPKPSRTKLERSQADWLKYRKAAFDFIELDEQDVRQLFGFVPQGVPYRHHSRPGDDVVALPEELLDSGW